VGKTALKGLAFLPELATLGHESCQLCSSIANMVKAGANSENGRNVVPPLIGAAAESM